MVPLATCERLGASGVKSTEVEEIRILRPDDWHLHLRDGAMLRSVLPDTAARFGRAIVMPNLNPPITTVAAAAAYRQRILAALPEGMRFTPLMTLYLTEATPVAEIRAAKESGLVHAVKYYPAGATTNSENGVRDLRQVLPVLAAMEELDLPLLMHGEVTDPAVDVFDREAVFIDRHLAPLRRDFPELRMVLEHVTTSTAVDFVQAAGPRTAATITAHHLLLNRNALFQGGIRPHHYCLPVLKREQHRQALIAAATSGSPQFFLGTDSAPHPRSAKESSCGCAGIYTAHAAIELYAEAFAQANALDRLEDFASRHGPAFYGLPCNPEQVTLRRETWPVPERLGCGDETVVPLRAGEQVFWRLLPF
ncbi:dihydroorotase [Acidithiobacillus sp. CV18-2]|uniref:Dihydroorotase n=1 Tax=Igneacidithiobacillus copahuensis TaxID=2724909 RepID=A0AAE3CJA2_9PROT|nr:dihydroorotase [Acidithiobacillus sp. CV18-3]MBU2756681.1 dihydroorotase [Acidithiobacillus sp. BN09-2]MBU2776503.1 dihydroorotase [Acidithiobacillus sp. CV18-2]MBU2787638.1 dihydroorotase [Igneacidithiobacillus copahuensis]MBU2797661.1 dihydroorotase [Acidithiobacillus sp. VAN18-2]MBU2800606.1 dihydroorotase [Acidithiobacillus sp. VAN18-4]